MDWWIDADELLQEKREEELEEERLALRERLQKEQG